MAISTTIERPDSDYQDVLEPARIIAANVMQEEVASITGELYSRDKPLEANIPCTATPQTVYDFRFNVGQ